MDDSIVTADFQGYVHWLDKASGALAARVQNGKVRVSNPPVVVGNTVVVINDRGQIAAYRVTPRRARAGQEERLGGAGSDARGAAPRSRSK